MLQVTAGLLLVLALIGGLAWAVARLGRFRPSANAAVRVVAAASVGPRERVAVIEVAGQWLVVGVAPGSVNLLDKLAAQGSLAPLATTTTATTMAGDTGAGASAVGMPLSAVPELPPFAAWLQRALRRKPD